MKTRFEIMVTILEEASMDANQKNKVANIISLDPPRLQRFIGFLQHKRLITFSSLENKCETTITCKEFLSELKGLIESLLTTV